MTTTRTTHRWIEPWAEPPAQAPPKSGLDVWEEETESLSSVEIAQGAKGAPLIKVKVYAPDVKDAGQRAIAEYWRLVEALRNTGGQP